MAVLEFIFIPPNSHCGEAAMFKGMMVHTVRWGKICVKQGIQLAPSKAKREQTFSKMREIHTNRENDSAVQKHTEKKRKKKRKEKKRKETKKIQFSYQLLKDWKNFIKMPYEIFKNL